jgi:hypothetical protein
MLEANPEGLLSKIGGRVDQNVLTVVLEQNRCTEPFIARVIRQTSAALAAYRRNADRRAGA